MASSFSHDDLIAGPKNAEGSQAPGRAGALSLAVVIFSLRF